MAEWDKNGRPVRETREWDAQGRPAIPRMGHLEAFSRGATDAATFGFFDEIVGAGGRALVSPFVSPEVSEAFGRQATERTRDALDQAQEDRPVTTGAGLFAGSLVPGFGVGGLVSRGVGAGGRMALAAGSGAVGGGAYGVGAGETPQQRVEGGAQGAALGAALGAAGHGILSEALPAAGRGVQRALRLPDYQGQGPAGMAAQDLMRTAQGNRSLNVSAPSDLARVMDDAAAREPEMMVGEALGQQGVSRLAALARMRGQTGQRVEDQVTQRARNQGDVLEDAFVRSPISGDALEQQVRQQWRERGNDLYEPILSAPPQFGNLRAFLNLRNSPLFQHRAIQSAWRRAGDMIRDDISLGRVAEGAANSIRHQLHYAKVALDEMIEDPTRLEPGLRNMNNNSIVAARDQLLRRMEGVIPGYTAARGQLADIGSARRAIEAGRQVFTRQRFNSNDALRRYVEAMPPGERPYFQAGIEDWVSNQIATAGRDGRRNVGAALLNDRFQSRLRIVFGQEAEPMIARARQQAAMFDSGNRMRPSAGSITSNMAFEAGDMAAPPIPTRGNMIDAAWRFGWNNTVGRVGERHRDFMGRVYSMPVGEFRRGQGGLLSRAQAEAQRREARTRLNRTRGAYLAGVGAAGLYEPEER